MTELDPPHPGSVVRRRCLEARGLTVASGARMLGVTRQALNNLVNGKAGISPDMAIRLSKVFGDRDESWLQLQSAYDLAEARKRAERSTLPESSRRPHPKPKPRPL
jgi:addiction module HigA family antidote